MECFLLSLKSLSSSLADCNITYTWPSIPPPWNTSVFRKQCGRMVRGELLHLIVRPQASPIITGLRNFLCTPAPHKAWDSLQQGSRKIVRARGSRRLQQRNLRPGHCTHSLTTMSVPTGHAARSSWTKSQHRWRRGLESPPAS